MRISDWSSDVCSSDLYIHLMLSEGNQVTIRGFRYDDQDNFARQRRGDHHLCNTGSCAERCCDTGARCRGSAERIGHRREDRKRVVSGKRVAVRLAFGGGSVMKNKKNIIIHV